MNVGFSATVPKPVAAPTTQRQPLAQSMQPMAEPVFAGKSGKSDGGNLLLIGLAGAALAFLATTLLRNQRQEFERPAGQRQDSELDRPLVVDKDLDGFR